MARRAKNVVALPTQGVRQFFVAAVARLSETGPYSAIRVSEENLADIAPKSVDNVDALIAWTRDVASGYGLRLVALDDGCVLLAFKLDRI